MPRIKINGINLNYELDGEGPTVVFIIGLTMDVNGWFLQVQPFSEKYRVLRYDCRGQGQSDKPDMDYSQEMHADDLKSLMDKLGIQKTHVIGISNGGMIAQHFTLRYPEKVGALVLADTCSYIDVLLNLIVQSWIKAAETGGSELRYDVSLPVIFSEDFLRQNLSNIQLMKEFSINNNPPRAVINLANACLKHNVNDRISDIKAPTLILYGEEDILIPLKYSKLLHEKIKGSRLVILKNCGHVPPIEKPEEFNSTVINFLKNYDSLIS
ncbi:MAG TPA: alpha/beta fold hydrolase [Thermodesulfobacteriota bacterium]|nr:alpha/beta fold hydrolase [Thermodesulfobacteriota bacterium]